MGDKKTTHLESKSSERTRHEKEICCLGFVLVAHTDNVRRGSARGDNAGDGATWLRAMGRSLPPPQIPEMPKTRFSAAPVCEKSPVWHGSNRVFVMGNALPLRRGSNIHSSIHRRSLGEVLVMLNRFGMNKYPRFYYKAVTFRKASHFQAREARKKKWVCSLFLQNQSFAIVEKIDHCRKDRPFTKDKLTGHERCFSSNADVGGKCGV